MADDRTRPPAPSVRAPAGERTDEVYVLAGTGQWIVLSIWTLLLGAVLAWGLFGRLHYRVDGMGVILREHGAIYAIAAQANGFVREVRVAPGGEVEKGDVLALLDLPTDEAERVGRRQVVDDLTRELERLKTATAEELAASAAAAEREDATQRLRLANAETQAAALRQTLRLQQEERRLGYVTRQQVEQTQAQLFQAQQTVADAQAQLVEAAARNRQFADQKRQVLQELERQLVSARAQLAETKARIEATGMIRAATAGRIVGTSVLPGAQVQAGQTVVSIERRAAGLEVLAFFPVTQGKAIAQGMSAEVSPTYIEREIYGSLLAKVVSVSEFAVDASEVRARLGDSDIGGTLTGKGPVLQARLQLSTDPSVPGGLRWTSAAAPPLPVNTGALASVSVGTRQIRPLDLVAPMVSTWMGLDAP